MPSVRNNFVILNEQIYNMANTYTHIQTVFTVQNKHCVIRNSWRGELYKYITGIIQNNGHKLLAINGMPDHIHIFFGMRPT